MLLKFTVTLSLSCSEFNQDSDNIEDNVLNDKNSWTMVGRVNIHTSNGKKHY